jgi:hypothetical protein
VSTSADRDELRRLAEPRAPTRLPRVGDAQVDQDLAFERREWRVQRVAWVAMLLVALAALAGLLGPGPLSGTSSPAPDGSFVVHRQRFGRAQAPDDVTVDVAPGTGPRVRLWVDRAWLEAVDLDGVVPAPARVLGGRDRVVFEIRRAAPGTATAVRFRFAPRAAGVLRGRVGRVGGPAVAFAQLVYP